MGDHPPWLPPLPSPEARCALQGTGHRDRQPAAGARALKGSPQPAHPRLSDFGLLFSLVPARDLGPGRSKDLPPPVGASSLHPSHTYCVLSWEPQEEDKPHPSWENSC